MDKSLSTVQKDSIVMDLTKAVEMLRQCNTAADAKKYIALGEAATVWAEQRNLGLQAQNAAKEIVIRAKRRLGEILAKQKRHKGGRPRKKPVTREVPVSKLNEMGISRNVSSTAQRLASVPEDLFEAAIAREKEEENGINYKRVEAKLVGRRRKPEPKPWSVDESIRNIISIIKRVLSESTNEDQQKIIQAVNEFISDLRNTATCEEVPKEAQTVNDKEG